MDWTFLALASRTKHSDGAVGQIQRPSLMNNLVRT
jgi:hypothetical protein